MSSKDQSKKLKKALFENDKVEAAISKKTGATCATQEPQDEEWDH